MEFLMFYPRAALTRCSRSSGILNALVDRLGHRLESGRLTRGVSGRRTDSSPKPLLSQGPNSPPAQTSARPELQKHGLELRRPVWGCNAYARRDLVRWT